VSPTVPAADLRTNVLTLAIPTHRLPDVAVRMRQALPLEDYDPAFQGQYLQTTYFDTRNAKLRKARKKGNKYFTLRIRCYAPNQKPGRAYPDTVYALSVKTEDSKYRVAIGHSLAEGLITDGIQDAGELNYLPPDLLARYQELADGQKLYPIVTVCFTRYAVESTTDRITLDTCVRSSTGKIYPAHVLEFKSTQPNETPDPWGFNPIHLSKFLWATS
jgi:hypothetical protein